MEASAAPSLPDSALATEIDPIAGGRSNPEEFQASLKAVRAAQETARARARRQTNRARLIVAGVIAALGLVAWNISPRRAPSARAPIVAPTVAPATAIVTPLPASPAEAAPVAAAAAAAVVVEAPAPATASADGAVCDSAFAEHRWQSVVTACTAAFKARPQESAIAMRVAQAQHRLGHAAAAGEWARSAIALDGSIAEAFVILARAEARAGHPRATATAYRRYLALAPRGWHAAEARRALTR